jgi:peroxiredoxin
MKLSPGMPAPAFRAVDLYNSAVDLADYQGKSLLLSFFRNAACAMCNLRVHALIERHAEYRRAGLNILAVFESPSEAMRQYVGKQHAPFPLIADPDARLYALYGVENSEEKIAATMVMPSMHAMVETAAAQGFHLTKEEGSNFLRLPADFLIGPDGIILEAHYADFVWDHLPFARIEERLGVAATGR